MWFKRKPVHYLGLNNIEWRWQIYPLVFQIYCLIAEVWNRSILPPSGLKKKKKNLLGCQEPKYGGATPSCGRLCPPHTAGVSILAAVRLEGDWYMASSCYFLRLLSIIWNESVSKSTWKEKKISTINVPSHCDFI